MMYGSINIKLINLLYIINVSRQFNWAMCNNESISEAIIYLQIELY